MMEEKPRAQATRILAAPTRRPFDFTIVPGKADGNMAREEEDRADLWAEATALVQRLEGRVEGWDEPVVAGFRREGSASVFLNADTVYHFNSAGELRRAYANGLLLKAESRRLVALHRQRTAEEVVLRRTDWDEERSQAFLRQVRTNLERLAQALADPSFRVSRQEPRHDPLVERLQNWLRAVLELPAAVGIARAPGAQ